VFNGNRPRPNSLACYKGLEEAKKEGLGLKDMKIDWKVINLIGLQ